MGGQFILKYAMPAVLEWILGGNVGALKESESFSPSCRISDIPQHFSMDLFDNFMEDDSALVKASRADWMLMPKDCLDFSKVNQSRKHICLPIEILELKIILTFLQHVFDPNTSIA